eukprot:TRINITY_DN35491_c0_g1_i1.p1 TRINITY_DN35491_c0_g1~~TRINITY_DN35491_c0_g1_i1.p1  ORF type:complete len:207 (-),score=36.77 TRINITY_DN35491_c0_g1_i1:68-688(-)
MAENVNVNNIHGEATADLSQDPFQTLIAEALRCQVCREQHGARRLLMEVGITRSMCALRRSLASSEGTGRLAVEEELLNAEFVLAELIRHREHTPFFKVVARKSSLSGKASYFSVYDGQTTYELGVTFHDPKGGCFVHASEEEAIESVSSFPRSSVAWGAPRALLIVRGEGGVRLRHGKVLFDGITPLCEIPWPCSTKAPKSRWRY